jgi:TPR repeat protein
MLAVGFALGAYREPIKQFVTALPQAVGLSSPAPSADDVYAAFGKGDYATVLRLAPPLADQGDARTQSLLGLVFYRGLGAQQDHATAMKWFRRAADQGYAAAQFRLGVMFYEGQGVPPDYAEAAKWYRLAADQGHPEAQYNLGVFYASGEAWEANNVTAYVWFSLAAAYFEASDTRRSTAVASRDVVAKQMTRDQIAEAQKQAREWKPAGTAAKDLAGQQ